MKYITIIGLEIHIEPNTKSKMFCSCSQNHFGAKPNSQTCPICLGLPGALPYANKEAINKTVKLGLALGSTISKKSKFYRKHYFYPDLSKSFQTSQKDNPFCIDGSLLGKAINHIHLEEDAGKLVHQEINGQKVSLVDFNRSGCCLIELVTEPVFRNVSEVLVFTKELQLIARYLDISGADMEKGTMRLEANISLSPITNHQSLITVLPNYKVELKNINSFRFLEKAINAEIERQTKALDNGEKLIQETRGYDENTKTTFSQRSKEDSDDYRYFPEADLPPLVINNNQLSVINQQIPELQITRRQRFTKDYGISADIAEILTAEKSRADYFETACKLNNNFKLIANLMVNKNLDRTYLEPAGLAKKIYELGSMNYESEVNTKTAIETTLDENPEIIKKYQNGQTQVIGFLIGHVQKILQGKGNPKQIRDLLTAKLHGN